MVKRKKELMKNLISKVSLLCMGVTLFSNLSNQIVSNASENTKEVPKNIVVHKEKPFDYSPLISPLDGVTKVRYIDTLVDNTGEDVFCLEHGITPPDGDKYQEESKLDPGVNWIIKNYYTNKEFLTKDKNLNYYITYKAIHVYLGQEDFMIGGKKALDPKGILPIIDKIVAKAKTIKSDNTGRIDAKIIVDKDGDKYKFENDKFISPTYSISKTGNGTIGDIKLKVSNSKAKIVSNNKEVTEVKKGQKFNIEVNASDVKDSENINVIAEATATDRYDYSISYSPTSSKVQKVGKYVKGLVSTKKLNTEVSASVQGVGRIKIVKTDEENGAKLSGAKFQLKDKNTGKVLETLITDKEGLTTSNWYPVGTELIIKEVEAPNKYILDGKEFFATITENMQIITCNITNRLMKGSISIHKIDKESKLPLKGVEFNVLDDKNNVLETVTTDENGNAKTKELVTGAYSFVEVNALDGYLIDNRPIKVNITENKEYSFTVENEKLTGSMELLKLDGDTKEPMKDVEFKVVGLDGFDKDKEFNLKTNEEGKVVLNGLHKGKFRLLEVKTLDGYVLNTEPIEFEITEDSQVVKLEMTNKKITGSMELLKLDEDTKEPMKDVEFKVVGLDGFDKDKEFNLKTNEEGKAILIGLHKGKFKLLEVKTLDGYVLNTELIEFEIIEDRQVVKLEMTNKRITGTLEFTKIDAKTGKGLDGARIKIECLEGFDKGKIIEFTSSKDGNIFNLLAGKYKISEIQAPNNYERTTETGIFEITEDGQIVKSKLSNKMIIKTLPATGYTENIIFAGIGMIAIILGVFIVIRRSKREGANR